MTSSSDEKDGVAQPPHFGHTKHGLPVHLRTADYHQGRHGQFNQKIAAWMNTHVMSMRCFWLFCVLACLSLPATLHLAGFHLSWLYGALPAAVLTFGWIEVDAWVTQNFIQLVLLPALGVGQNLQNAAADARAAKQFEDLEEVRDWLDLRTQGGLTAVLAEAKSGHEDIRLMITTLSALLRAAPNTLPVPDAAPVSSPAGSSGTAGKPAATKKDGA